MGFLFLWQVMLWPPLDGGLGRGRICRLRALFASGANRHSGHTLLAMAVCVLGDDSAVPGYSIDRQDFRRAVGRLMVPSASLSGAASRTFTRR